MRLNHWSVIRLLGFMLFALMLFLPTLVLAEVDITDKVEIIKGRMVSDRRTGDALIDVSVRNVSNDILVAPFKVIIKDLTTNVTVGNADGYTTEGEPYFEYWIAEAYLDTNEDTSSKRWVFNNPTRTRFSYSTEVLGERYVDQTALAESVITSSGGSIETLNGGSVYIPELALNSTTTITVEVTPVKQFVDEKETLGRVDLGPSGTTFEQPIAVVIPLAEEMIPGAILDIYFHNEETGSLELYKYYDNINSYAIVLNTGRHAVFLVDHFSSYYASAVTPGGDSDVYIHTLDNTGEDVAWFIPKLEDYNAIINGDITHLFTGGLVSDDFRRKHYKQVLRNLVLTPDYGNTTNVDMEIIQLLWDSMFAVAEYKADGVVLALPQLIEIGQQNLPATFWSWDGPYVKGWLSVKEHIDFLKPLIGVTNYVAKPIFDEYLKVVFLNELSYQKAFKKLNNFQDFINYLISENINKNNLEFILNDYEFENAFNELREDLDSELQNNKDILKNNLLRGIANTTLNVFTIDNYENLEGLSYFASESLLSYYGIGSAGGGLLAGAIAKLIFDNFNTFEEAYSNSVDRALMVTLDEILFDLNEDVVRDIIDDNDYSLILPELRGMFYDSLMFKMNNSLNFLNSKIVSLTGENYDFFAASFLSIQKIVANYITIGGLENITDYYIWQRAELESDLVKLLVHRPPIIDQDNDGVSDENDNCRSVSNPTQTDIDNDGIGDVCDNDADGDGFIATFPTSDLYDCNDNDPSIFLGAPEICGDGIDQDCSGADLACVIDLDSDGIPDSTDNCPSEPNPDQSDIDNDGIGDVCDSSQGIDLTNGLVAYYPFDGNALDESGNGHNGTVNGATLSTDRFGNLNSAYLFDGVDDNIKLGNSSDFDFTTECSFSVWIRSTDDSGGRILNKWVYGHEDKALYLAPDRSVMFYLYGVNSIGSNSYSNERIGQNEWVHVVAVYDGENQKIYVNGELDTSFAESGLVSNSSGNLFVGENIERVLSGEVANPFGGDIDDIRIYNRALSADEITELYSPYSVNLDDGLIASYPFNGNANDESGNGHNGTVNGASLSADRLGNPDSAYVFDGVDDTILLNNTESLNLNSYTISGYFKTTPYLTSVYDTAILSKWAGGSSGGDGYPFTIRMQTSDAVLATTGEILEEGILHSAAWDKSNWPAVYSNKKINDGIWHQFIVVRDNDSKSLLYIDGILADEKYNFTLDALNMSNDTPIYIAGSPEDINTPRYFKGNIDDIKIYNRALNQAEISALGAPPINAEPNLVGYWSFDNCKATDSSGLNNNGFINGDPVCVQGQVGSGMQFDGIDDFIEVPNSSSLNSSEMTISAWVNPHDLSQLTSSHNHHIIINKENQYEIAVFGEDHQSGSTSLETGELSYAFHHDVDGWYWKNTNFHPALNEFVHVVVSYDQSNLARAYINGQQVAEFQYDYPVSTGEDSLRIAARRNEIEGVVINNAFFNGIIDEVKIYNRALSSADILAAYESTQTIPPDEDGDGIADSVDNCPSVANSDQLDADSDGIGDVCDSNINGQPSPYQLSIVNPSFEVDRYNASWVQDPIMGPWSDSGITGWVISSTDTNTAGVWAPSTVPYPSGVPEQINVAFANDGVISQQLAEVLLENYTYQLNVYVGQRTDLAMGSYSVQLLAGGNVVAEESNLTPQAGQFLLSTNSFTALPGNPYLGLPLEIRLSGQTQVNFDDVTLHATPVSQEVDLNAGLVAYYPFDGDARDLTGNGNDGTVSGATLTYDRFGNLDSAYSFDGVDDYIEKTSPTPALNIGNQSWSAFAWIKTTDAQLRQSILSRYECGWDCTPAVSAALYDITIDGGVLQARLRDDLRTGPNDPEYVSLYRLNSDSVIIDETWHYVGFVLDRSSSEYKMFIDGDLMNSMEVPILSEINDGGSPLSIGRYFRQSWDVPINYFKGDIDDIRIYNRALTQAEISALSTQVNSNDGLLAYYPFNGNAVDESGNDHNGTVNGATLTTDRFGNIDSAYSFDGSDYLSVNNSETLDIGVNDASIVAWVNFSETQPHIWQDMNLGGIAGKGYLSENAGHGLYVENGKVMYQIRQVTGEPYGYYYAETNNSLNDGLWHLVVATVDRDNHSGIKMYVDGVLQSTTGDPTDLSGIYLSNPDGFAIGAREKFSEIYYNYLGKVDDIRVYNRVLSEEEIEALFIQ